MKDKRILYIGVPILMLLLVSFLLYRHIVQGNRNVVEQLARQNSFIHILVAGSHSYNENRHNFYAVFSLNPENSRIGISFIPPSYRIVIDKSSNRSVPVSEVDFNDRDRILASLEKDLHLEIPFYVELYSPDVERAVNLYEGVELFNLDQMKDEPIPFGEYYFDGEKAVSYIHSVADDSIYGKYDRILDLVYTIYYDRDKMKRLLHPSLVVEGMKKIQTNILPQEALRLVQLLRKPANVSHIVVPGEFSDGLYYMDDISYKIYQDEFITRLVIDEQEKEPARIKILNGTSEPGLARKMRNRLIREGLNVIEFGTWSDSTLDHSIMISRRGNMDAVQEVSSITGISRVYHVTDSSVLNSILIIIGKDHVEK